MYTNGELKKDLEGTETVDPGTGQKRIVRMRSKKVNINFGRSELIAINSLMSELNMDFIQDLLRHLINTAYETQQKRRLMYGESKRMIKKDAREARVKEIELMSDETLTEFLNNCGFSEPFEMAGNKNTFIMRDGIYTQKIESSVPGVEVQYLDRFDKKELIRQLIRDKKI